MPKLLPAIATLSLLVIAACLSVLVARSTLASVPDSSGVIHACYYSASSTGSNAGALRIIDNAKSALQGGTCKPGETPITWGATGPAGAPGTPGTPGTPGISGVSGYQVVEGDI